MGLPSGERNLNSLTFNVRVVPRASKTIAVGEHDGALKVRVAAPPVDNAANAELCRYLAEVFDVSRRAVKIVGGLTSKTKRVKITGAISQRLLTLIAAEH